MHGINHYLRNLLTNEIAKDRQDGRDFSDWSRKGPLPDLPGQQRKASDRPSFPGRSFDNMSDAGSDRGGRRPFEQGDGKVRDFSNWERKGPLSPAMAAAPSLREGGRQRSKDGPAFRKALQRGEKEPVDLKTDLDLQDESIRRSHRPSEHLQPRSLIISGDQKCDLMLQPNPLPRLATPAIRLPQHRPPFPPVARN